MTPTPEHKLRTLIHAHRKAIDTILDDAQARVGNAILTANTEDDGATHEAIAAGVTLLNSARGRLRLFVSGDGFLGFLELGA